MCVRMYLHVWWYLDVKIPCLASYVLHALPFALCLFACLIPHPPLDRGPALPVVSISACQHLLAPVLACASKAWRSTRDASCIMSETIISHLHHAHHASCIVHHASVLLISWMRSVSRRMRLVRSASTCCIVRGRFARLPCPIWQIFCINVLRSLARMVCACSRRVRF